jgi:hypothetical protein
MQGKYFLDEIDGITYSTDSYAIYNFYVLQGMEKKPESERTPLERSFECTAPANKESFLKGLEQEKEHYAEGYRYILEWVRIRGKVHRKGRWIKEAF